MMTNDCDPSCEAGRGVDVLAEVERERNSNDENEEGGNRSFYC